jgi:hypothetical protein
MDHKSALCGCHMKFIYLLLGIFAKLETYLFETQLIVLVDTKNNFVS